MKGWQDCLGSCRGVGMLATLGNKAKGDIISFVSSSLMQAPAWDRMRKPSLGTIQTGQRQIQIGHMQDEKSVLLQSDSDPCPGT